MFGGLNKVSNHRTKTIAQSRDSNGGFIDQSARVDSKSSSLLMQRRLQEKVDHSGMLKKQDHLVKKIDSRPHQFFDKSHLIQREKVSKLSPNRLNVVGEEHDESDARRPKEKKISKDALNTSWYWEEHEFVNKGVFTSEYGDDKDLRLINIFSQMIDAWKVIEDVNNAVFTKVATNGDLLKTVTHILEFSVPAERFSPEGGQTKENLESVNKYLKNIERGLTSDPSKPNYQDYQNLKYWFGTLKDKSPIYKKALSGTIESSRISRSDHMNKVANDAAYKYAGVWKVGDKHIGDIKDPSKTKYAFMTRADFNANYFGSSISDKRSE